MLGSRLTLLTAGVALLFAAAPASAATRYAAPAGSGGPNTCLDPATPCQLQHALVQADPGDEVVVQPGDYPTANTVQVGDRVDLHGVAGQPRPRIVYSGAAEALTVAFAAAGTTIRHLELESPSGSGLLLVGSTVVREVLVRAGLNACQAPIRSVTFLSSVCLSTGSMRTALRLGIDSSSLTHTIRNVTAVATGASSTGLALTWDGTTCNGGGVCSGVAAVTNTIARGAGLDVSVTGDNDAGTVAHLTLGYSSFDPAKTAIANPSAAILDGGANQAASPLLDGAVHQLPGSPTIDAGLTDSLNGPFDFEGDPRLAGAATDIGADEYVPPAPSPPGPDPAPASDVTAPAFLSAGLAPRRARAGTTFRYSLDEAARVTFTIERVLPGRRVGRRCVKPRRSNRSRRRCRRHVVFARFAQQASIGANSRRWSGRKGRRRAPVGRYRATLIATDAVGNASPPKRLNLRVVRRVPR
jgi:hypothetical protein